MSDKPLAYVSSVKSLDAIEGKDRIVLARFKNHAWQVIVQKGPFEPGDKAVHIETGAILPVRYEFKFLEAKCFSAKYDGYKIKTIRMGGVYSEGIVVRGEDGSPYAPEAFSKMHGMMSFKVINQRFRIKHQEKE